MTGERGRQRRRRRLTWFAGLAVIAGAVLWWYATERSSWRLRATLPTNGADVYRLAISPDGSYLAASALADPVALWKMPELRVATMLGDEGGWGASPIAFSPDGSLLAVNTWEGVILCDLNTFEMRTQISLPVNEYSVSSFAFSPSGTTFAAACGDGKIRVWDVTTGREFETLQSDEENLVSIAYSPDGRFLAAGSYDLRLEVWTLATREKGSLVAGGDKIGSVWAVAFSPDSKTLAAAVGFPGVVLWDVASWSKGATAELPEGATCIAFSPDGSLLAAGAPAVTTRFSGPLRILERFLEKLGFDPTGFGIIHIYDAATLRELARFKAHRGSVNALVFSPDGRTLVTGGDDETVRIWEVPY